MMDIVYGKPKTNYSSSRTRGHSFCRYFAGGELLLILCNDL